MGIQDTTGEPYQETCDVLVATTRDPYTPVQWLEPRRRGWFISERAGFTQGRPPGVLDEDDTLGYFSRLGNGYLRFYFQNWPGTEEPDTRYLADDPHLQSPTPWIPSTLPPRNL